MRTHAPRKRFGQHFLHDKNIIQRIVDRIAPTPSDHIVEIGPGQGALTVPLLKTIGEMDVIEIDRDLIPALKLRCEDKGILNIYEGDALVFDLTPLIEKKSPLRLVGNLPYNISTPLIFHLLEYANHIQDMHFMLQKEVVHRIAAEPNTSDYGRLSIMVQYHCQVQALFDVGAEAFYPPPQVESSVVRLIPHHGIPYPAKNYSHFTNVVKMAFSHRRKTLRNSLKKMIHDSDWQGMEIDSHLRPEQIGVKEYVDISNYVVTT
ncbi:MAG TPA: 16S rRNA (adenine(1518)-N(6)/adenine(1519)-N(6))-dimethyltransferase RsmA [Gammaproteobacteria bacterium]|jgi:16S rRNA (adenine1518-N6/adenine1519-N6)-dimethyltransferase|nr:16S rRNA (adenine(1518)-N(6)/adenine(1519)-N(6))-dimethyltransferase RsmA [Gammaproteobacteria bacterium]